MSLCRQCGRWLLLGFPRVSGDEPTADLQAEERLLFSPRERG